jgi:hypothetical protein
MNYKITRQILGQRQDVNNNVFDNDADALAQAVNIASEFCQRQYTNSKAGKVGVSVCRGSYGAAWELLCAHEDKVGIHSFFVEEVK